jgi:protein SCO1/2
MRRLVVAACLLLAGPGWAADETPQVVTTAQKIGGPFRLTSSAGVAVTDRSFAGKWLVIYFGYTFCPDACPTALTALTIALRQLGADGDRFQPLFITVDPQRDTPAVLDQYVKNFDHRLVGLFGTPEQTAAVAREFRVYYQAQPLGNGEYSVDHSSYFYLVNPAGKVVELLTGDVPGHRLADELRQLIK